MAISRGAAPACRILLWAAACLSSLSGHDSAPTDASSRVSSLGILAAKTNMGFRQWRTGPAVVLLRGGGGDERVGGDGAGGDDDGDGAQVDADAAAIQEECAVPAEQPAPARPKSSYRRSKPLYKIKADGTAEIFSADGTLVETRQPESEIGDDGEIKEVLAADDPKETLVVVNVLRGMRDQFREPDEELEKNMASFISRLKNDFGVDKDWTPRRGIGQRWNKGGRGRGGWRADQGGKHNKWRGRGRGGQTWSTGSRSIEEWDELGAARSGKRPTPSLSSVMGYSGGSSGNRVQQHQRSKAATEAHASAIADDAEVETGAGPGGEGRGGGGGGGIRWDEENLKANEGVMAQVGGDVISEAKTPWQRSPADSEASSQAADAGEEARRVLEGVYTVDEIEAHLLQHPVAPQSFAAAASYRQPPQTVWSGAAQHNGYSTQPPHPAAPGHMGVIGGTRFASELERELYPSSAAFAHGEGGMQGTAQHVPAPVAPPAPPAPPAPRPPPKTWGAPPKSVSMLEADDEAFPTLAASVPTTPAPSQAKKRGGKKLEAASAVPAPDDFSYAGMARKSAAELLADKVKAQRIS